MFVNPTYYQQEETSDPIDFAEMPRDKFAAAVSAATKTNSDRYNEAIAKSDGNCFWLAHPEFLQTAENVRLINLWLKTKGIENPTYPDFEAAYTHYRSTSNLLDLDKAELARDPNAPRSYKGVFTKQTFYSVSEMIGAERQAALREMPRATDVEKALGNLPIGQAQAYLKNAERAEQARANAPEVQFTADSWLLLHPEFVDDRRNAELLTQQILANKDSATMEAFEKAARQLRENGLLKLKQSELNKQRQGDLRKNAAAAAKYLFDETTEAEAYDLPLDEVRRRANGNYSGRGL